MMMMNLSGAHGKGLAAKRQVIEQAAMQPLSSKAKLAGETRLEDLLDPVLDLHDPVLDDCSVLSL